MGYWSKHKLVEWTNFVRQFITDGKWKEMVTIKQILHREQITYFNTIALIILEYLFIT